jgi:anti-sigma B factor antagonist
MSNSITTEWKDNIAIMHVVGDIDLSRSASLQAACHEVVNKKPDRVIVDFSEVPYMDSSGVASMVKLLSRTKKTNTPLILAAMSARVRAVLQITRLDRVFTLTDTVEDALN